jgi:hypothetical protein
MGLIAASWKSQIKCRQKTLTSKSKSYIKNLRNSVKKKSPSGSPQTRVCSKCGEEKPLDKDHYQVVKYFQHNILITAITVTDPRKD